MMFPLGPPKSQSWPGSETWRVANSPEGLNDGIGRTDEAAQSQQWNVRPRHSHGRRTALLPHPHAPEQSTWWRRRSHGYCVLGRWYQTFRGRHWRVRPWHWSTSKAILFYATSGHYSQRGLDKLRVWLKQSLAFNWQLVKLHHNQQ